MATHPAWHVVLRSLREARGLTQDGWAIRLGYSRCTLVRWERGDAVPDAAAERALLALCQEQDLFRHFDHGPLAGCAVTAAWLQEVLAAARLGTVAGARAVPPVLVGEAVTPATNLPVSVASFVGREHELADILRLLTTGRLLTLTGSAGTGKTRLALQAAAAQAAAFPDGVWFVDLAPLDDPTLVPSAVAQVLGVQALPDTLVRESVLRVVRDKRMLLVLDNYEHLLPAAEFTDALLRTGPGPTVLVTSRAPLRIPGEREYGVPPLPLPPATPTSLGELANNPAVALFVQRAQAVQASLRLTAENAAAVAAICTQLDGLPLAIELAAVRVKVLPPAALLARLERRLPLLVGGARTLPQRQQTLRNTIQWSWDLLPPLEQVLFRRLAVFSGGWTLEAAEVVCNHDGNLDVLTGLAALVDHSLVQQSEQEGAARFRLLATLREFALEQLEASGEGQMLRRAHAEYYCTVAEQADAAWWRCGRMQQELMRPLDRERDNLVAALSWALSTPDAAVGLRLCGALGMWFRSRAPGEGDRWLQQVLHLREAAPPSAARGRALFAAGCCAESRGGYVGAVPYWEEAAACLRTTDDLPALSRTLALLSACLPAAEAERSLAMAEEALRLGRMMEEPHTRAFVVGLVGEALLTHGGDYAAARVHFEEALRLARAQQADWMMMWVLDNLGILAMTEGQQVQARAHLREALPLAEAVGDGANVIAIKERLAVLAATAEDYDEAAAHWRTALVWAQEYGITRTMPPCLAGIAGVVAAQQRFELAVQLLAASDRLWQAGMANQPGTSLYQMAFTQALAATEAALSPAEFTQAWAAGQKLSSEQATGRALRELASLPTPTLPPQPAGS